MNIAVRYYTKTGNTKKLADEIARAAGVEAQTTDVPLDAEVDILFLGSSVYAAGVDSAVKNFIADLSPAQVKKVVNFSTAALLPSTYKQVKELVEKKGIVMAAEEYHCKGSFGLLHKSRPNETDLEKAYEFAQEVLGE